MSPQEAHSLVGHSPAQKEADICELLRSDAAYHTDLAGDCDCRPEDTVNWQHAANCWEAADEIERLRTMAATVDHDFSMARIEIDRLRTALRAVRASTDPAWQLQIIKDALREGEGT